MTSVPTAGYAFVTAQSGQVNLGQATAGQLDLVQLKTSTSTSSAENIATSISFDRPVRNVSFTLGGLTTNETAGANRFTDAVWVNRVPTGVSPANVPATPVSTTTVYGSGISGDAWIAPAGTSTTGISRTKTVTFSGVLPANTPITVHYYSSAGSATNQQAMTISNIAFDAQGRANCPIP